MVGRFAKDDLFPLCLGGWKEATIFELLSIFGGTHTVFACRFVFSGAHEFRGSSFLSFPWVEYPSCSILSSPVAPAGYLCSSVEHIREEKPRRMGSQVTAVCKGGGDIYVCVYICRYIICFRSKFFSVLVSQLPSVVPGGDWGACPVTPPHPMSTLHFSWLKQECVSSLFHPFRIVFVSAFFSFAVVLSQWYLSKGQTLCLREVAVWLFQLVHQ